MPARSPQASVDLEGETQDHYDAVMRYVTARAPGIRPKPSDILRCALFLAADTIHEVQKSEGSTTSKVTGAKSTTAGKEATTDGQTKPGK